MQTLTENNISLDLREAAAQAAQLQPVAVPEEALEGVLDFVARRLEQLLVDEGCGIEAVKAVLSERGSNPAVAAQSARELQVRACTTWICLACSLRSTAYMQPRIRLSA